MSTQLELDFGPEFGKPDIEAYLNPDIESMLKQEPINPGHYLELMDRLHVVLCTVNDHIFYHPISLQNKEVAILVENAIEKLAEAYQLVGSLEESNTPK
jgi:hypothetical protein